MIRTVMQCDNCEKEIPSDSEHHQAIITHNRPPTPHEISAMGIVPVGMSDDEIEERRPSLRLSMVRDEQTLHFCTADHLHEYFSR